MAPDDTSKSDLSRRDLLRLAGAAGAGVALGAGGTAAGTRVATARSRQSSGEIPDDTVPFYGEHQGGIATAQQEHMHFVALDVISSDTEDLTDLLKEWTKAAALMSRGEPVGDIGSELYLPPEDTGEAIGLSPANLTITFGFGPTLFEKDGTDRFGLADRRPEELAEIPSLPGESLEEAKSNGDLCIQACADDQQVTFHAVRNLVRISRGKAVVKWAQMGFGRVASTSRKQDTPRNLMGLKDGTNNIKAEDTDMMASNVWASGGWMDGGSYMVSRRIRMFIEIWDRVSLLDQEQTIGRHKISGAPLGEQDEFADVDLDAEGEDGYPVIPLDSHVRLARENTSEEQFLRRGYSYTDGMDYERGQLDAGLFFICFQRDPHSQFVPMQERLGSNDALNEYIVHTGSALFACPPGCTEGGFIGEGLFT